MSKILFDIVILTESRYINPSKKNWYNKQVLLEDKLLQMFNDIQEPFEKHCPKNRKNFLSYSYTLYKFFQLLKKDEYLIYFPLLKSREKLFEQEFIWKQICEELGWTFIKCI